MANELSQTIRYHIKKYRESFDRKLGLTEDDLMNEIREQVWKGLINWQPDRKANKKTYMNALIQKRFSTLHRRSKIAKNNTLEYYADVYTSAGARIDDEMLETRETGEELLQRRQEFMQDRQTLSGVDREIYADLLQGFNIEEMMDKHSRTRIEIISAINEINDRITERRSNTKSGAVKG